MSAPARRAKRFEEARLRARGGERVEVFADRRRLYVPVAFAAIFAAAAIVLLRSQPVIDVALGAGALVLALALAVAAIGVARDGERPLIAFDARGVWYRAGARETTFAWSALRAGYAAPGARRFVVLLLPRDDVASSSGAAALPSHSEFRAHELLSLVRAYSEFAANLDESRRGAVR